MLARATEVLGAKTAWLTKLVRRVREAHRARPGLAELEKLVLEDAGLARAIERKRRRRLARPKMGPGLFSGERGKEPATRVPELVTETALAVWLGVRLPDLLAFADLRGFHARAPLGPRHHYRYHWLAKRSGSKRLIEAPKEMLRDLQQRILHEILDRVPAHEAAHGFVRGRSVLTYARPHCAKALVLRMDLRDFFPSVGAARIAAIFRALGYPDGTAWLMTGLVTTRTPEEVLHGVTLEPAAVDRLRRRHLPQGAPTSPALANLSAFGLDVRLSALAASLGASYTRYADDLAFSGDERFRGRAEGFRILVCRIAAEEGFSVRWEKNRWMRPSVRQRLGGLVLNERPRPSREEFDRLKATLTNCVRKGPLGQNRDGHADYRAHLRGRVAWFEHVDAARGARLRALLDRIPWSPGGPGGATL